MMLFFKLFRCHFAHRKRLQTWQKMLFLRAPGPLLGHEAPLYAPYAVRPFIFVFYKQKKEEARTCIQIQFCSDPDPVWTSSWSGTGQHIQLANKSVISGFLADFQLFFVSTVMAIIWIKLKLNENLFKYFDYLGNFYD